MAKYRAPFLNNDAIHLIEQNKEKYLVIFIITNTMAKMLLVIFVVINHHNKRTYPTREKGDRL